MTQLFQKDPQAVSDYKFDFASFSNGTGPSDWLSSGETILTQSVSVDDVSLSIDSATITDADTSITVWLSGGVAGRVYMLTCHITTSLGRATDQTLFIQVLENTAVPASLPLVPHQVYPFPFSAVSLPRYASIIQYDECAFWGVTYENQPTQACSTLWNERQRQAIAEALAEAQQEIEQYVGFFLAPTYVNGALDSSFFKHPRYVDEQRYTAHQTLTRYANLLEFGKRAVSTIYAAASVNYSCDPVIVGPIATTINSIEEVHVYLPGSDREIVPSEVTYSGGYLIIYIPRCRLVKEEFIWSDSSIPYETLSNFTQVVDVKRVYTDTTQQVDFVSNHSCNAFCSTNGCSEFVTSGCGGIVNKKLGLVELSPATWGGSSWVSPSSSCCSPRTARLYYRSGLRELDMQAERALVRLAHTKMPQAPCDCSATSNMWKDDRFIPKMMNRTRMNCPFGLSDGAWTAFRFAQPMKIYRGGVAFLH